MTYSTEFLTKVNKVREKSFQCNVFPIGFDDALVLYTLVYTLNNMFKCINIIEIGTGCGYSTAWLAQALKDSLACGKIISFEVNNYKASKAQRNIDELGLNEYVLINAVNALEGLRNIDLKVNMVFLDADQENYLTYVKMLESKLQMHATITAHNAYWLQDTEFTKELSKKGFKLTLVPTEQGILIAFKN